MVAIQRKLMSLQRCHDRILSSEDDIKFLELSKNTSAFRNPFLFRKTRVKTTYSTLPCLREKEVEDCPLYRTPEDEDDVSMPTNVLEGHRPCKLPKQAAGTDGQAGKRHTLGAHLERENLNRV